MALGYGAMVWSVDLDLLRTDIGSGDRALARRYGAGFAERYHHLQEDVGDAVTLTDVARHMIMGEPYADQVGFAYGYFLQFLCDVHGTFLDNRSWMPVPVDFSGRLDEVLAEAGLLADGFSVTGLMFGGAPVPLPRIDDFPGIGYYEHGALKEAADQLARAGVIDLPDEYGSPAYFVFQWLAQAHDEGRSLVGFFH
jgi:hypothetical protein